MANPNLIIPFPVRLLSVSDLHGSPSWMDWILSKAPDFDAVLLPGDLLNGWAQDMNTECNRLAGFFESMEKLNIPCVFCTGNHDAGLIPFLKSINPNWKTLFWDGWFLHIHGVRIRVIGYLDPLPTEKDQDSIWLYHVPPENTPVSTGRLDENSFGCTNLELMAHHSPETLPPLVIGGHQHDPENWHWKSGKTQFLNSGQNLKQAEPNHFVLEITGREIRIKHSNQLRGIPLRFNL